MDINKLAKCQIIPYGTELFKKLEELDDPEMEKLRKELDAVGYFISYNSIEDVFVIH